MPEPTECLGDRLIRVGALTPDQSVKILDYQKSHPDIRFGEIAIKLGFLSQEVLNKHL